MVDGLRQRRTDARSGADYAIEARHRDHLDDGAQMPHSVDVGLSVLSVRPVASSLSWRALA